MLIHDRVRRTVKNKQVCILIEVFDDKKKENWDIDNKTIKPIIVRFTIPITALTLGIFYPFVNVIILKIVDLLLFSHFEINGIWFACLAAILISVLNIIMDNKIIKPVIKGGKK